MSSTQSRSGAQKRKKAKEEQIKIQKLPKISHFFSTPKTVAESSRDSSEETEKSIQESVNISRISEATVSEETCSIEFSLEDDSSNPLEGCSTIQDQPLGTTPNTDEDEDLDLVSSRASSGGAIESSIVGEQYVTDRGHYPVTITDPNVKRFILAHGPCRPPGPFPRDNDTKKRCFSESYYERVTKTGLKLPLMWLCYSPKLNAAYCEPCWLFADRKKVGFEPAWAKGIQKWQRLSAKIQIHESSQTHMEACVVYDQWRRNKTIDEENEKQI